MGDESRWPISFSYLRHIKTLPRRRSGDQLRRAAQSSQRSRNALVVPRPGAGPKCATHVRDSVCTGRTSSAAGTAREPRSRSHGKNKEEKRQTCSTVALFTFDSEGFVR